MAIRITSGPVQVLHQGMVTTFGGRPLRLEVEGAPPVVLSFTASPALAGVEVDSEWDEEGALRLRLVNFDTDEGRGSAQPVLLAEVGPDLLFFHFRAFRFGETDEHTVQFTFYSVDKDDVGWQPA